MAEGLDARLRAAPPGKPEDRDAWLGLANARKVLGENDKAVEAFARADAIAALAPAPLADWAEAHVRLIAPGAAPAPEAVAVLEGKIRKAEEGDSGLRVERRPLRKYHGPMTDELERLLEVVKDIQMTPAQQEEQRRSFAYGNTKIENDLITRQMIDEAAERLARNR